MVEVVSNLLKLTDYPFSYTIAGLLLLIHGHGTVITKVETFGPLLLIMGVLGTTLSIIDPLGNLMRYCFKKFTSPSKPIDTKDLSIPYTYKSQYLHKKASKSVWVTYEIDKFVSMLYFFLVLGTIIYFLINSFSSQIQDRSSLSNIICDAYVKSANITEVPFEIQVKDCRSGVVGWIFLLFIAEAGVFIVIIFALKRLFNYVRIVAGYFFGTEVIDHVRKNPEYQKDPTSQILAGKVETNCKEELDYLNKKDWTMAGIYWDKNKDEVGLFKDYPEAKKEE